MERPFLAVLAAAPLVFVIACSAGASDDASTGGQGGDAAAGATGATGTTGSGFGAGQGGSTVDPGEECLKDTFGATAAPANLLFQIDVSGSMNCAPLDTGCGVASPSPGSRWEVFQAQLVAALDTLPSTSGVGLMHYPTGTGTFQGQPTGCVPQTPDVPLGDLATAKPSITSALDAIVPAGGTPTHDAITAALAQLSATPREGSKFLVLATDGQATFCSGCDLFCTSDELAADTDVLVQKVAAAAASGVRTFVLGAPGSNGFRGSLSRLATAGQTPSAPGCSDAGPVYCHYDMTTSPDFGQALAAALAAIGGEALGCVYDIPPNPDGEFDPTLVNVQFTVDGQSSSIPKDTSHAAGWDYSPDGKQIILYGEACDEVKSAGTSATVDILYGCPTIVK
jgi:hypothetical protein